MNTLGYIYLAIVTIVMIFMIIKVSDLIIKLKRLKKRYDLLLRGRNDFNLEELLRALSHDVDLSVKKVKAMESNFANISSEFSDNKSFLDSKMMELNTTTNSNLSGKLDRQFNNLEQRLISSTQNLDKKYEDKISKLITDLNKVNSDLTNMNKNLESNLNTKMSNLDKKYNDKTNNLDSKYTSEVDKINETAKTNYKKLNEKLEYDVENLKQLDQENYNKLLEIVNKEDKAIDDNLAFAIQQVSLYKYNALSNQSGDLSFTMVLLDRMKNGVMLTSINGRDASYTYSKEIKNGKALVDISPEEEKALRMVVKK